MPSLSLRKSSNDGMRVNLTHSLYKRMTDGKVARRAYPREERRKTPGEGALGR